MNGHGALHCYGSRYGMRGTLEGDEKPISRRVNLVTIPRLARLTEQSSVLRQYLSVLDAQVLEEVCGVLDVAEQEGDGATRCLRHTRCPLFVCRFPRPCCAVVCGQAEAALTLCSGIIATVLFYLAFGLSPLSVRKIGTVIAPLHPRNQLQDVVNRRYPQR
jgi:hypothetical protein